MGWSALLVLHSLPVRYLGLHQAQGTGDACLLGLLHVCSMSIPSVWLCVHVHRVYILPNRTCYTRMPHTYMPYMHMPYTYMHTHTNTHTHTTHTHRLADDEMEMGLGLHGEPGAYTTKLLNAHDCVAGMVNLLVNPPSPTHARPLQPGMGVIMCCVVL